MQASSLVKARVVRIIIVSITIGLSSISALSCESAFVLNLKGYEDLSEDLESAWRKTASFKYLVDNNSYWKSPKEFERDGGGDCEDFSAYLMYHLGEKSEIYFIMRSGHTTGHAVVKFEDKFIEPQAYGRTYSPAQFEVLYTMSYREAMLASTYMGLKSETGVRRAASSGVDGESQNTNWYLDACELRPGL